MPSELEQLGLEAARAVAGPDAVEKVEVSSGIDSLDRPAYHFSFLIHGDRSFEHFGLVRLRLLQRLNDTLEARGDGHLARITLLDRTDWDKRARA